MIIGHSKSGRGCHLKKHTRYDTQLRGPLQRPVLQHRWTGDASLANDPVHLVRLALTPPNRKHSHHQNDRRVLLVAAPEHRVGRALLRILVSPVVPRHATADPHVPHQSVLQQHLEALPSRPAHTPTCHAWDSDSVFSW